MTDEEIMERFTYLALRVGELIHCTNWPPAHKQAAFDNLKELFPESAPEDF